jgi:integrase
MGIGPREEALLAGRRDERHVLPAATRAGISKKIGWRSFRRTLATLLQSSGASVKTTQELIRHPSRS